MSVWVEKGNKAHYYSQKGATDHWAEFQNGSKVARFEQVSESNGTVFLRNRIDGVYVKLTSSQAFWGTNTNQSNLICEGGWQKEVKINEKPNPASPGK